MNKANFLKLIFLSILITSCGFKRNSFENYKETINETLNPKSSNLKQVQNIADVKDMKGCGYMEELNSWHNKKLSNGIERWGRRSVWHEPSGIISYGGFIIGYDAKEDSSYLSKNSDLHIVYIGPWQYVKRIGKEIRFVAFQDKDYKNPSRLNYHGTIRYQFESKTLENQNIKSKPFNLLSDGKPAKEAICIVKWIANYGYNAISEVKSKNPFSSNYLVPTGKIIEVEE